MNLRLKNALPKCSWCEGPCHPKTAHVVTDEVPSNDPALIPDEYVDPPDDGLLGLWCSEACLLQGYYELKAATKVEQGLVDWNDDEDEDLSDWEDSYYDDEDDEDADYWKFGG